jgi:hypothetical protein
MVEIRVKRNKDSRILHDDDEQEVKEYFSKYPPEEIVQEVIDGYVRNEVQLEGVFNLNQ